jgi:hypothetical protein
VFFLVDTLLMADGFARPVAIGSMPAALRRNG